MQTECLGDCVDEGKIRHACRNDVANIDADEVPVPYDGSVLDTPDLDQYEKDDGDEEEKRREKSPYLACTSRTLDLGFREFGNSGRSSAQGCSCGITAASEEAHGRVAATVLARVEKRHDRNSAQEDNGEWI